MPITSTPTEQKETLSLNNQLALSNSVEHFSTDSMLKLTPDQRSLLLDIIEALNMLNLSS
jgi:hypothetical protein